MTVPGRISERVTAPSFRLDAIVIGGGVNGAGTFRDLALRGLRVALFEKEDFGAGTSGASSGMIHGGLRYMLSDPDLVRETCNDSGRILRVARHLAFRIPFIVPVIGRGARAKVMLAGMESVFRAYDGYASAKAGRRHVLLDPAGATRLEPGLSQDMEGAVTFDEWGIDVHRLCLENVLGGEAAGGRAWHHARVESLERIPGGEGEETRFLVGVRHFLEGGRLEVHEARAVVNAAGPWGPGVARLAGASYRLRPSRGVHLVFDRRIANYAIASSAVDGRTVYLEPWQNVTIAGCTDDDYYGDPDDAPITHDDAEYLLEGIEKVFPAVRDYRVVSAWVGVRPTLYQYGPVEEDMSRGHRIFDHASDGVPGMFSIGGGKLAAFRQMSEEAADAVSSYLGRTTACTTGTVPLPGSEEPASPRALASQFEVRRIVAARLAYRHGGQAREILTSMLADPSQRAVVCRCEPVTDAEIRWAVRRERAATLDDLMRRTRLGSGPCGGRGCASRAASVMGEELGWSPRRVLDEAARFVEGRWARRRPVLRGVQARAEMLR